MLSFFGALLVLMGFVALFVIIATRVAGGTVPGLRDLTSPPEAPAQRGRDATGADVAAVHAMLAPRLEPTRRPVARITLEPMPIDDRLVSKVGGSPYWPEGEPPSYDSEGMPLTLLAQVALAEVPRPLVGYPETGMVQFFIAANDLYGSTFAQGPPDEQKDFRVVYWPETHASSASWTPIVTDRLPHDPARPRRMRFALGDETMTVHDHRFGRVIGGTLERLIDAYAAEHGVASESLGDAMFDSMETVSGHKLGGYPYFVQEDPRSDGVWELFLQLDSDDEMMWGDAGVASFFMDPAALASADFSRVLYTWDCS